MALDRRTRRRKVKARIRKKISGNNEKPRLSVFRSNKHIYVQLVDDVKHITMASASSKSSELSEKLQGLKKVEQAEFVGKLLAEKALAENIKNVVFDRSGYKFHGRVKALADGARKGGLIF